MSFGGQFGADAEMERRLQEEYRRRQIAGQQPTGTPYNAPRPNEYSRLGMIGEQSPYYQRAQHAAQQHAHSSPYTRATHPYSGLAEAQRQQQAAHPYGQVQVHSAGQEQGQVPLGRLYAEQQLRQQQAVQQAVQANYAVAYGHQPDPRYSATFASRPPATTSAYSRDSYSGQTQSAQDVAMIQQQQQRDREQAALASAQKKQHTPKRAPQYPAKSPVAARAPATKSRKTGTRAATQKVTAPHKKESVPRRKQMGSKIQDEDTNQQWYTGCVPLGLDDDKYWLSELQVYLRSNFAEAFGATEEDIAAPMHGRNKPIALGQVGIRCMHCKHDNPAERGQQATSYPSLISGIYNSVQQMLRLHLDCCLSMPVEVRQRIEQLKLSCSSRGGRKQYWIDSAKRLGLVDTPHGIHFGRDPHGPLPPLTGPSVNSREGQRKKKMALSIKTEMLKNEEEEAESPKPAPPVDTRPLVFPEDKPLISDYLYLTLEQMAPCSLTEADRVGCYKTRKVGFPGLACKHCVGQAGCGRYFPASEASLSQTTTSQTIMNHVRNCRRCPIEIRENLEIMKRSRMGPDRKRPNKPKHGGRKVFFHRLWCRIQGIPYEEGRAETRESKKKYHKKPGPSSRKKRKGKKRRDGDSDEDSDEEHYDQEATSSDEETESEEESDEEADSKPRARGGRSSALSSKKASPWYEGCVRLTKSDDPHWLTEMECLARSELVEVFSLRKKDTLEGYSGRKDPAVGQVGIRCIFCKSLDPAERPNGCISFPDAMSSLHTKIGDMIRLHFPGCPSMPDDIRETFKSLRGYDAKVADDDSQQYWVDSARDIGLSNIPAEGHHTVGAWGITFRRDPLQPSPADELDLEGTLEESEPVDKNLLVRSSDRGLCTDQVMLLLRQVRPCRFKKSDRRAGPGSRGRDRAMGFPGLACMHCTNKNTLGRYFPVSAKNLTDNTVNSLQAHVSSCSRCPEPIKASLAYLSHRSILQKAELSGSWKKAYFKKVWDRLHVERTWTPIDDEEDDENAEYSSGDEYNAGDALGEVDEARVDDEEGGSDSEKEELGENMNALIKAAAIWLTEQDQANDGTKTSSRAAKGRSLPAKRSGNVSPSRGSRGSTALPTKRRRVHF